MMNRRQFLSAAALAGAATFARAPRSFAAQPSRYDLLIKGGRVIADWPGLTEAQLYEGRDLKPTVDLRAVLKGYHLLA